MISDLTASTRSSPYTEVLRLDKILSEAHLAIPADLQLRSITKSITDHPDVIIRRIFLALIFHKAQCVLHRKYLVPINSEIQYSYSRKICVEAALNVLQLQNMLHQGTQLGGQLYRDRWKISSLVNHDFLLAVTILCLELNHDLTRESISRPNEKAAIDLEKRDTMTRALYESHKIWLSSSSSSREAQKAVKALYVILEKVKRADMAKVLDDREKLSGLTVASSNDTVASTGRLDILDSCIRFIMPKMLTGDFCSFHKAHRSSME